MKKFCNLLLTATIFAFCLCAFAGCRSSKAGVYRFDSMTTEFFGETVRYEIGDTYLAVYQLSEEALTVELKSNGTYSLSAASALFAAENGTWSVNKNDSGKIDITVWGETQSVVCDGKILYLQSGPLRITLKKI